MTQQRANYWLQRILGRSFEQASPGERVLALAYAQMEMQFDHRERQLLQQIDELQQRGDH